MDNIDGKHARNIKWCSPLGDWLDHALDIVSYLSIITSFSILSGVGIEKDWFFCIVCSMTYAIVIWEAHLCGELIIHPIEGCSEGMFLFACMHILFAIRGDPTTMFEKVVFVMPESKILSYVFLSGTRVTVLSLFITVEYFVSAMSLLSVAGVVGRLSKQEPILRVLSACLGLLIPITVVYTSSGLFNVVYPEAAKVHPGANILQLVSPVIYSIYNCNLCRLMGWRYSFIEVFTRPQPVLFALLPWLLALVLPSSTALFVSAACSTGSLLFWFFSITIALKRMLGIPLLRVGKKQEKEN